MSEPENKPVSGTVITPKPFRPSFASMFVPSTKKGKSVVLAVLIVCVLGLGTWAALHYRKSKQHETPALKVGNYSYSRAEYQKLIAEAKDIKVSEPDAYRALKDALASRQAADDLKISYPTDRSSLNYEATLYYRLNTEKPEISDYQRNVSYTPLIKPLVALAVHGMYKVGYIEFPFARYIVAGNAAQWHNLKLINEDITYAKTQAQQYRQAAVDGKQTIEALADKSRADKRLTNGQVGNLSAVFYSDERGNMFSPRFSGNTVEPNLLRKIKQAEVGKVSGISSRTWSNDTGLKLPSIQHGRDIDISYYFMVVQSKTSPRPTLVTDFNTRKQGYL